MNKLKKMLAGVSALIIAGIATTPLMADSSDFAGPYLGFQVSANGVELDGQSSVLSSTSVAEVTTGTIGKHAVIGGAELGYAIPVGANFLLDIGYNYVDGSAKISTSSTDTLTTADVTFEITDLNTVYIAPTVSVSDTSALYLKIGYTQADTKTTGDVTQPEDLEGVTVGIGTRTMFPSGVFVRTEAGITEYDRIDVRGKAEGGTGKTIATTTKISATPKVAYGAVSLGLRF